MSALQTSFDFDAIEPAIGASVVSPVTASAVELSQQIPTQGQTAEPSDELLSVATADASLDDDEEAPPEIAADASKAVSINSNKAFDVHLLDAAPVAPLDKGTDDKPGRDSFKRYEPNPVAKRTTEVPKAIAIPIVREILEKTVRRMSSNPPLFSQLKDFIPGQREINADAIASRFGVPGDTRFRLGEPEEKPNEIVFKVSAVGEVRFSQEPGQPLYTISASAPYGLLAKDQGTIAVKGERNVKFSYEEGKATWSTKDPVEASRLFETGLNLLAMKASLDKALSEGLANRIWHETDKIRHIAAGKGELMKGEYPTFGRDKNDTARGTPLQMNLRPYVNTHSDAGTHVVGVYLGHIAGVHVLLVPRTDMVLVVPESLAGKAFEKTPAGQHLTLNIDGKGELNTKVIDRSTALASVGEHGRDGSIIEGNYAKSASAAFRSITAGASIANKGEVSYAISPIHALDIPGRSAFQTVGKLQALGQPVETRPEKLYRPAHTRESAVKAKSVDVGR